MRESGENLSSWDVLYSIAKGMNGLTEAIAKSTDSIVPLPSWSWQRGLISAVEDVEDEVQQLRTSSSIVLI